MLTSKQMADEANDLFKKVGVLELKAKPISQKRLKDEFEANVGIEILQKGNYSLIDITDGEVTLSGIVNRKVNGYIASYGVSTGGTCTEPPDYDVIEVSTSNSFEHVLAASLLFIIEIRIDNHFDNLMEERRYQEEKEMGF